MSVVVPHRIVQRVASLDNTVAVEATTIEGFARKGHAAVPELATIDEVATYSQAITSATQLLNKDERPRECEMCWPTILTMKKLRNRHFDCCRFPFGNPAGY